MNEESNFKTALVSGWFISYFDSGIISLTINTVDRWIAFHQYTDHLYSFGEVEEDDVPTEKYEASLLSIPQTSLVFEKGKMYLSTQLQNKDQIYFYFIPFDLLNRHSKKIITSK